MARAALGFGGPLFFGVGGAVTQPIAGLLRRALAALGDDDSALRARVMGRLAAALAYTGVEHRRPVVARQALQMARRVADKATLADVMAMNYWATRGPDGVHEGLAAVSELVGLAEEVGDGRLHALARTWLLDHLLELGEIDAVERELEALQDLAATLRERHTRWLCAGASARHALLTAQLERCEDFAREARAQGIASHNETPAQTFAAQMVFLRREQARLDEIVETIEHFAARYPAFVHWRCVLAYVYAHLGRREQASQQLEALAGNDFKDLPPDVVWFFSIWLLCDVVVLLDDPPRAELLYDLLEPYADHCLVTFAVVCRGSASHPLGLLATTLSRFDDATRHFEHALQMNSRIRSPLWTAHTQHDYARMLIARGRSGDNAKALGLLEHTLATAEQLGLKALADEARPVKAALVSEPVGSTGTAARRIATRSAHEPPIVGY
jgi:tetratricopeptide (TPR) repeat protein